MSVAQYIRELNRLYAGGNATEHTYRAALVEPTYCLSGWCCSILETGDKLVDGGFYFGVLSKL